MDYTFNFPGCFLVYIESSAHKFFLLIAKSIHPASASDRYRELSFSDNTFCYFIGEKCFDNFDYQNISEYTEEDIQRIIKTEGIIKSEKKIRAVIHNAQCFLKVQPSADSSVSSPYVSIRTAFLSAPFNTELFA